MTAQATAVQVQFVCDGQGRSLDSGAAFDAESDDRSAVLALAEGDAAALRGLAQRHSAGLLGFLVGLTGDRLLAEEILQDTWVALWRGAGTFSGGSTVRTWIYGIARRRARDALRFRRPAVTDNVALAVDVTDGGAGPEQVAVLRDEVSAVAAAIARLGPRHREVLLLACVQDMAASDIASALDIPVGTVKSRLSYARAALVTSMAECDRRGVLGCGER